MFCSEAPEIPEQPSLTLNDVFLIKLPGLWAKWAWKLTLNLNQFLWFVLFTQPHPFLPLINHDCPTNSKVSDCWWIVDWRRLSSLALSVWQYILCPLNITTLFIGFTVTNHHSLLTMIRPINYHEFIMNTWDMMIWLCPSKIHHHQTSSTMFNRDLIHP